MTSTVLRTCRRFGFIPGALIGLSGLALLLAPGPALALDPSVEPLAYAHEAWLSDDGLPHNTIHAAAQTPEGYLWFATWNGVARYNGQSFRVFNSSNTPTLGDSAFRALLQAPDGSLWLGSQRGMLYRYADGVFSAVLPADTTIGRILVLADGRDGSVLVGTQGEGLYRVRDGQAERLLAQIGPPGNWIQSLWVDADAAIWIGTGRGLYRYAQNTLEPQGEAVGLADSSPVYALLRTRANALYVGNADGLFRRRGERFEPVPLAADGAVSAVSRLHEDRDGNLWVGTQSLGLLRIVGERRDWMQSAQGLTNNRVTALHEDREGSLWVGTNAGLNRLGNAPFANWGRIQGLPDSFVRSIVNRADGDLWIGTSDGLARIRDDRLEKVAQPDLASRSIMTLLATGPEELWIGTYDGGLARWTPKRTSIFRPGSGIPNDQVRALMRDRQGTVWVGTAQGVARFRDGTPLDVLPSFDRVPVYVLGLYERMDGTVLIGTTGGYVEVLPDGRRREVPEGGSFPAQDVFGFHEDEGGALWLATDQGLLLRDGEQYLRLGRAQGLPTETLFGLYPDRLGGFWITTDIGVLHLRHAGLADAMRGTGAPDVELYDRSDGLAGSQINGGNFPSASLDDRGRLWLPTARGLSVLDPKRLEQRRDPTVTPVVEEVIVDGEPRSGPLALAPGTRRLRIGYAGLSFVLPERVVYRHRLLPFDSGWSLADARAEVNFTNLAAGNYRFEVQASLDPANFTGPVATLEFQVAPHWWERRGSWVAIVLAVLALGLLLHRLRVRELARNERRLAAEVLRQTEELSARNHQLEEANQANHALLETIRVQADAYARQAREDSLTQLANRRACMEVLAAARTDAALEGRPLPLALADLDHFKQLNDRHGHAAGDAALVAVAQVLKEEMQPYGLAARFGGEEFVLLYTDASPDQARRICEDVRIRVAALRLRDFPEVRVTVSIGLVTEVTTSEDRLLILADQRLYAAKAAGRNRVVGVGVG